MYMEHVHELTALRLTCSTELIIWCLDSHPVRRKVTAHIAACVRVTVARRQRTPLGFPPCFSVPSQGPSNVKNPLAVSQSRAEVTSSARGASSPPPTSSDSV